MKKLKKETMLAIKRKISQMWIEKKEQRVGKIFYYRKNCRII